MTATAEAGSPPGEVRRREVTKEALTALVEDRRETKEIAAIYGVDPRTVRRWVIKMGILPPQPRVSIKSRITPSLDAMLRDGMPVTWAVEGLDLPYGSVLEYARTLPERKTLRREFQLVWPSIFNDPKLLELHNQFAPTHTRGHRYDRD